MTYRRFTASTNATGLMMRAPPFTCAVSRSNSTIRSAERFGFPPSRARRRPPRTGSPTRGVLETDVRIRSDLAHLRDLPRRRLVAAAATGIFLPQVPENRPDGRRGDVQVNEIPVALAAVFGGKPHRDRRNGAHVDQRECESCDATRRLERRLGEILDGTAAGRLEHREKAITPARILQREAHFLPDDFGRQPLNR